MSEKTMTADYGRLRRRKARPRYVGDHPSLWRLIGRNGSLLLQYRKWHGMRLLAAVLVRDLPGGRPAGTYYYREDEVKKRLPAGAGPIIRPKPDTTTVMLSSVPTLVEHLAETAYDDGTPRKTGEVRIRVEGSLWAVQCTDIDTATFFSATAPKLDDALSLAALMLACDDCPWEAAQWLLKKLPKKAG